MKTFNYTTHSKQVLGDMHTPVSIYLKVRDMYPQSALMESSDYHAGENSLSFIALCPLANIGVNSGIVTANYPDNSRTEEPLTKTFTVEKAMNRFINQFQVTGENKNVCGLYGYTTFNAVKYFEHIPVKESHDDRGDYGKRSFYGGYRCRKCRRRRNQIRIKRPAGKSSEFR